jgi:polyhydroxyalkanoate synthase subunit PhaC
MASSSCDPRLEMNLAPTARDVVFRDGGASVLRFRRASRGGALDAASAGGAPLLLVPSLINRWYVLDLRAGASLVEALVSRGLDVYCLDWGVPEDEDRYLAWDDVVARLARAARFVRRDAGAPTVGLLGYCMGGTLAAIQAALSPAETALLVNLAGPIDFSLAGQLRTMVDAAWFDADAIADAGNIGAVQMQTGFQALRPTLPLSKWVTLLDRWNEPAQREAFLALEAWGNDNVPFPAAAYRTYIKDLYQRNALVQGEHFVSGRHVDLARVRCPVLTIVADHDTICPPPAATALNEHVGSKDRAVLRVPGGHVGAVVGSRATRELYPALAAWLEARLGPPVKAARPDARSA